LPPGFDASELLIHAKERGLLFAPGRYFYVQSPLPNTLRLGFANLNEKELTRGAATLADLLRVEMRKRQRGFGAPNAAAWRWCERGTEPMCAKLNSSLIPATTALVVAARTNSE